MDANAHSYQISTTNVPQRSLILKGYDDGDALVHMARGHSANFNIYALAQFNSFDHIVNTVNSGNCLLDKTHVVVVVLNANDQPAAPDGCNGSDAPGRNLVHALQVAKDVRKNCPHAFILLWHALAVEDPCMRLAAFSAGANMVSCFPAHVEQLLGQLASIGGPGRAVGGCTCAWCGQEGLTPNELWLHQPLYHIYDANRHGKCSACGASVGNLAVHIHEQHHPSGPCPEVRLGVGAAVVVHRRSDNKFLMVQEFAGQGFWVPGGCTDEGETIRASAIRECLEEAGVEVDLLGLVEVDYILAPQTQKLAWCLTTFYAVLKEDSAAPKTLPCFESAGACWVKVEELDKLTLRNERIPKTWFPHFATGGQYRPLAFPTELQHFPNFPF